MCYSISDLENFSLVLIDQDNWVKETCLPFRDLIKKNRRSGPGSKSCTPLKIYLLSTCISLTERNRLKSDELLDDLIIKPLRLSALTTTFQAATGKKYNAIGKPDTLKTLLRGKEILVVDDNAVNRRVAEGALRKYGAVVTCVDGGNPAVELLEPPHKFDACFMDLQMPGMDG